MRIQTTANPNPGPIPVQARVPVASVPERTMPTRRERPRRGSRPVRSPMKMAVPMGFKRGGRVRQTGWAKVHKGERITPAAHAMGAGKARTKRLIENAGREIKTNPPKVLARTKRKSGAKRAAKQKVAIMLSKARAAGAEIPEK